MMQSQKVINFKTNYNNILLIGIQLNWQNSRHLLCSWHKSLNFKKRFMFLNKQDKDLYNRIVYLPYQDSVENYQEIFNEIKISTILKEKDLKYLMDNDNFKDQWCKAFVKERYFTAGIYTNQRVEAINGIFKRMDLKKSLQETLNLIKNYEPQINENLVEEKDSIFLSKKDSKNYEKINIIQYYKTKVCAYIIEKIKSQLIQSLNYEITDSLDSEENPNKLW